MAQYRKERSFTLIELIMTIVAVGIIAVPLSLFVVSSTQSVFKSHDYTVSSNLALLEMEHVNNLSYATLSTGTTNFPSYQGYPYNVARTVVYVFGNDAATESLKRITVTVSSVSPAAVVATLDTYIAKNVTYGL